MRRSAPSRRAIAAISTRRTGTASRASSPRIWCLRSRRMAASRPSRVARRRCEDPLVSGGRKDRAPDPFFRDRDQGRRGACGYADGGPAGLGPWQLPSARRGLVTVFGHYHERFVRVNGAWLIAEMKLTLLQSTCIPSLDRPMPIRARSAGRGSPHLRSLRSPIASKPERFEARALRSPSASTPRRAAAPLSRRRAAPNRSVTRFSAPNLQQWSCRRGWRDISPSFRADKSAPGCGEHGSHRHL